MLNIFFCTLIFAYIASILPTQVFDEITCGRSICDSNGHLNLEGFKSMAHRLRSAHSAAPGPAAGRHPSIVSSAKAAVTVVITRLQHLLCSSADERVAKERQNPSPEEKEDTSKVCNLQPEAFYIQSVIRQDKDILFCNESDLITSTW
jgi:hypothetical protein